MPGTPLVVHWLRLLASTAEGVGSILGLGTKVPPAIQRRQKHFFFFLKSCVLVCMHSMFAWVWACMSMCTLALAPAAPCKLWWGSHPKPSSSPVLSHKASESSIVASPGPEEPGKHGCGGGEGKDAHCCPSLLYWDEVMWSSPSGRWDEWGGLPGGCPYPGEILRRTKKNSYLRQDEKFQDKIVLCPFESPPSPLESIVHL